MKQTFKSSIAAVLCAALMTVSAFVTGCGLSGGGNAGSAQESINSESSTVEDISARVQHIEETMTTEQKVAQMIMPAIRSWNEEEVKDLSECPRLAEALRRHQYCGVILFGQNIEGKGQTVRLTSDLQLNNAESDDAKTSTLIPYMIAADQEGGSVCRISMGTRGTGSMAIGATGENAEKNAEDTGRIFGEELSALGINVNLGPCVDVITDLTDMGMSTRVFSDDPKMVAKLGAAFERGVENSDVVTTFKHFPGAGDGSDYPTSIKLSEKELRSEGLSAYKEVIENGADMIMTSATTFPNIDEKHEMADGSEGYYPATLSPLIVTDMLRKECGFGGVVITDALEMEQFVTEPDTGARLFNGELGTIEHDVRVAEKAIDAGCDILLIPADLNKDDMVGYYDEYIAGITQMVEEGKIKESRIDESVERILTAKAEHGILDIDTREDDVDDRIKRAQKVVGSAEHHKVEERIAKQAVTLLKNEGTLPISEKAKRIVIIGRSYSDDTPIRYALSQLKTDGVLDRNVRVEDRIVGKVTGDGSSDRSIVIDRYYNPDCGELTYSDELSESIQEADIVICISTVTAGADRIQNDNAQMIGVKRALSEAHAAGAKFVLLSNDIPVDAVAINDADAIVCAYLSNGLDVEPIGRSSGSKGAGAFNANVPAALKAIFGATEMTGVLPIDIPVLERSTAGTIQYGDELAYKRGDSVK